LEHFGDGGEATGQVGEGEVILVFWAEDGQDENGVEVVFEDIGFAVTGGVDVDGFVEHFGVAGDGG